MAPHTASPNFRYLALLLILFAGLVVPACSESGRSPSSPSAVTPPTAQAEAIRSALTTQESPDLGECLRHPQSCLQPVSVGRALDLAGPTNLGATVNGTTVVLSWSAPAGVSVVDYIIEVRNAPGQPIVTTASSGGRTSFTATTVPAGTYYVSVRAQLANGFTNPSNEVAVTVAGGPGPGACTVAPGAPSGISASVSGSTITLTWTAASGSPAGYVVDAGSAPGLSNLASGTDVGAGTTLSAPNMPAGTYYVRVRARNSCGTGSASNEVSVTVTGGSSPPGPVPGPGACTVAPGAPSGLRGSYAVSSNGFTITLSWTAPSGSPASYLLDAGSAPGTVDITSGREVGVETTMSAPDQPGGTYYFRIRAKNNCGTGPASNEISLAVGGFSGPPGAHCTTAPSAPSGLHASAEGSTITLGWTAAAGATNYLLDAGSAPGLSDFASAKDVGVQTTMSAPNQPAGTYYVRVRGANNCGISPASNEVSVTVGGTAPTPGPPGPAPGSCTTAPGAPSGLRASVAGGTITLSWTAPSGSPASYLLDAGSAPGLTDISSGREVGVETTMSAPSQPNGTYYMRIRARNSCGTGPASNEVSVTVTGGAPRPTPAG